MAGIEFIDTGKMFWNAKMFNEKLDCIEITSENFFVIKKDTFDKKGYIALRNNAQIDFDKAKETLEKSVEEVGSFTYPNYFIKKNSKTLESLNNSSSAISILDLIIKDFEQGFVSEDRVIFRQYRFSSTTLNILSERDERRIENFESFFEIEKIEKFVVEFGDNDQDCFEVLGYYFDSYKDAETFIKDNFKIKSFVFDKKIKITKVK